MNSDLHIVDILMRALLASIGWTAAFAAGRMRQAEETWMFGRSFRFAEWLLTIGSAVFVAVLAII